MKKAIFLLAILFFVTFAYGQEIDLARVYSDGAVLKQNSEITIRGWANPNQKIHVVASWNDKDTVQTITANSGQFLVKIKTPKGSFDKHTISFNGQNLMRDVVIGEVWLCSGQSNMHWNVNNGITDGEKHASEANDDFVRFFNAPLRSSLTPQENIIANWVSATPQMMRKTSSIGYFFATEIKKRLNVPVGILVSAWGGASVEPFIPKEYIENDSILKMVAQERSNQWKDDRIGGMYNAMIHPLLPYSISGVLWYQGESNVQSCDAYEDILNCMIGAWRDKFEQDFPLFLAQIAPYNYSNNKNLNSAWLRHKQQLVAHNTHNCGWIVLSDLVNDVNNIHPIDKLTPALRFADLASARVYGIDAPHKYPVLKTAVNNGKKVVLTFDELVGDIKIGKNGKEKAVIGVSVIDSKGGVHPTICKVNGRVLEVSAKGVSDINEVRYEFDDYTIGNLFSSENLPVAPFSTKQL